jgi:hypothetical protein
MDGGMPARSQTQTLLEDSAAAQAMKNTLIATISTFLSHYFNPSFLQSGWLFEYPPDIKDNSNPDNADRRLIEMKIRFLYCVKATLSALAGYHGDFRASAAYEEDRITDALEIISTPEHAFTDDLLNRCTDVMITDLTGVELSDSVAGQFLRRVFQVIRQDVDQLEHVKFLYLFCVWNMPEVLFDSSVAQTVRNREVKIVMADPRMPADLVQTLRTIRGGGIFDRSEEPEEPVDEGWDLEMAAEAEKEEEETADPTPRKRSRWLRFFTRS